MTKLRLVLLATTALTAMQFVSAPSHAQTAPLVMAQAAEPPDEGKPRHRRRQHRRARPAPPAAPHRHRRARAAAAAPPHAAPPPPPPPSVAPPPPPPPHAAPPPPPHVPRHRLLRRPCSGLSRRSLRSRQTRRLPCSLNRSFSRKGPQRSDRPAERASQQERTFAAARRPDPEAQGAAAARTGPPQNNRGAERRAGRPPNAADERRRRTAGTSAVRTRTVPQGRPRCRPAARRSYAMRRRRSPRRFRPCRRAPRP